MLTSRPSGFIEQPFTPRRQARRDPAGLRRAGDVVRLFTQSGYDRSDGMTWIRWIALVTAAALASCAHDPPAATIPATTTASEPAPAGLVPAPAAAPAPHSPAKIAPAMATAPTTTPRPDGLQELRDYCKTASRVSCQRASEKQERCFQLKSVAFGIHLQVIASSRSMNLSEAQDLAARKAHDLPPDLAVAIASQVTPGTLADSFANEIYRRCLTS
jgi:hypothetical protein